MSQTIKISNVAKDFISPDGRHFSAVKNINLEVQSGQLVTLLGPSGCGKTTLLRMIAGFETPSNGDIFFGTKRVNDIAPSKRNTAMVFQSYAIFPHLNVFENVAFGLRLRKMAREDIETKVANILDQTGLTPYRGHAPSQLSGGQQQRVALARCLVMEPDLLLFDEPLSNLDAKLREHMRLEIRQLQQRVGITALYVTHDQVEAMSISDRIVVMKEGSVEQVGTAHQIYAKPVNRFVADFIGKANFVEARMITKNQLEMGGILLPLQQGIEKSAGENVTVLIRPEAIRLTCDEGMLSGIIQQAIFLGNSAEYLVRIEGIGDLLVEVANPAQSELFKPHRPVFLSFSPHALHLLPS